MRSLSLLVSECSPSGLGQGHASNFYIVDLENFATASSHVYRWYPQLVLGRFVYVTNKTMEATRSHHGWVHMFITHCLTVTLQRHNFNLFRTCRTSSFCTVAWQLARFQLTRRIVRSLGDSWVSCCLFSPHNFFRYRDQCAINFVRSAITHSTGVGAIHDVDCRRGLLTTPVHKWGGQMCEMFVSNFLRI